jgi:Cd2+/Zn2+-exporting ATPase
VDVVPAPGSGLDEAGVLRRAGALEARSEHPLARAVVQAAADRGVDAAGAEVRDFEAIPGRGVRGTVDGEPLLVGRPELFDDLSAVEVDLHRLRSMGRTVVAVGSAVRPVGLVALLDQAREGAAEVVAALRREGVKHVVMLTGDNPETAAAVAETVGVDAFEAGLLPEEKVEAVARLERTWGRVAMVGDGVNDGPALAAASVGIAMGAAGSDVAIETADVALMGDDLSRLPYLMRLSRRSRSVIRQNIGASIVLKATLAIGVPLGWVSLILAVVAGDMGATLGVTGNALRLGRMRP